MIHEDEMWEIIADLGWSTKTTDYKLLGGYLREHFNVEAISQLKTFVSTKRKVLTDMLNNYADHIGERRTVYGLGDDSFGDLVCHIIGLGKEEYYKVVNNPKFAKERADKEDFKENFAYIFQYVSDTHPMEKQAISAVHAEAPTKEICCLHITSEYRGDHTSDIAKAVEVSSDETLNSLCCRLLKGEDKYKEYIELRFIQPRA